MTRARFVPVLMATAALLASAVVTASPALAAGRVPLTTGADSQGQQGNGAAGARTSPAPVSAPEAVAVASGRDTGYLLDAAGYVWAWGDNGMGQVGDGTATDRQTPVQVDLSGVEAVEAGHYHALALRTDGSVWAWGYGNLGQLGLGAGTGTVRTPRQIPGLSGVREVVGGRDMSYAVMVDGTVRAWGANSNGEIGDGTTTTRQTPVTVPGLTEIVEVSAGRNHAVALDASGGVWAWGDNTYGQVGNGSTTDVRSPVRIATSGYLHVDAGAEHSIGVRTDGTVATWGRGYRGQLGLGSTANRTRPTTVPGLSGVVDAGDGRDQSYALTTDGRVWAWGNNTSGQLGDGTTTTRSSPVLLAVTGIADVVGGSTHAIFLPADEGSPVNLPPVASISVQCAALSCTLDGSGSSDPDGDVTTWQWQLGDGESAGGAVVSHAYGAPGDYQVSLVVTDDAGATATTSTSVHVEAVPTGAIEHVGAQVSNANAVTHRVTVPGGVTAGDLLVLAFASNSEATPSAPAGGASWQQVAAVVGSGHAGTVWVGVAQSGAGATITVTVPSYTKAALALSAYRGAELGQAAIARETVSRATHTTPALTSTGPGELISIWADKTSSTTTITEPAGTTERLLSTGSGSGRITLLWADQAVGAGQVGGLTATASSATSRAVMASVLLVPAG